MLIIRTRLLAVALPHWLQLRLLIAMPFAALLGAGLGLAMPSHGCGGPVTGCRPAARATP